MKWRANALWACLLSVCAVLASDALAQVNSAKVLTIVVASPPGGPPDMLARSIAPRLEKVFSESVIVENRPGAGTYIGNAYVARSRPDGQTLLLNALAGLHSDVFMKDAPIVLVQELVPVAAVADSPQYLVAPASLPVKNLKEFVDYARNNPGKLNVALFPNTAQHLELISFVRRNGLKMEEVAYNSTPQVMTAMVRGDVHLYVSSAAGIKTFADEGRIKVLAVNSRQRTSLFPDVQTTAEQGLPMPMGGLFALFATARTPADIVKSTYEGVSKATADPELWATWTKLGFIPNTDTPEQLKARLLDENKRYHELAASIGIKPE
jgi:tripartite-type tricarboxylate transporter receptor subunit TctC